MRSYVNYTSLSKYCFGEKARNTICYNEKQHCYGEDWLFGLSCVGEVDELFESEDCECNVSRTGGGANNLIFLLLALSAALFARNRYSGKR